MEKQNKVLIKKRLKLVVIWRFGKFFMLLISQVFCYIYNVRNIWCTGLESFLSIPVKSTVCEMVFFVMFKKERFRTLHLSLKIFLNHIHKTVISIYRGIHILFWYFSDSQSKSGRIIFQPDEKISLCVRLCTRCVQKSMYNISYI